MAITGWISHPVSRQLTPSKVFVLSILPAFEVVIRVVEELAEACDPSTEQARATSA